MQKAGLENFKDIILDFKKVSSISQGFADEIFRVFQNDHPDIHITAENTNPVIQQMISHVVDNK
ncbi:MAG: STAS-like domain-containing protein [Deltaproteobacteria bacterium]|nr:STAS-like domain-containing protein [Deltaproteobacteria bacterium]